MFQMKEALRMPNEDGGKKGTLLDENCVDLLRVLLSGELITKFNGVSRHTPMAKVPNTFTNHTHYQEIFDNLFQYEIYCRMLGRDNDVYSHMAKSEQDEETIGKAGKVM